MEALTYLSYIVIILLAGMIIKFFSKYTDNFFLIILGILLSWIIGKQMFPDVFLSAITIIALVLVVFDASSRFRLVGLRTLKHVFKLIILSLLLNIFFLSFFSFSLFKFSSIFTAILFAVLMTGTDPIIRKANDILESESLINTLLVVLLPFVLLEIPVFSRSEIIPLGQNIVLSIGVGILVGLIMFRAIKRFSHLITPLALITSALLAYIIAEHLEASGVIAVISMGMIFGNLYVKHKAKLQEYSTMFAFLIEIIVFVLLGFMVKHITWEFFIKSLILFLIYLVLRTIAVFLALYNLTQKDKVLLALNCQKGIAVAAVALAILPATAEILNLIVLFILYSIITSTITWRLK